MLASYNWICELAGFKPNLDELLEKLTFSGLEVADVRQRGPEFDKIVVAKVVEKEAHPDSKKLSLVKVDAGNGIVPVVCGAPNCPGPGHFVVFATVGAQFGDLTIAPRKVAGYESHGMICSEEELDIGPESDGIIILEGENWKTGTPIKVALELEDTIMELEVTPNRPDALYHRGLARETCLLFDKPFETEVPGTPPMTDEAIEDVARVEIIDSDACPRYSAAAMKGIKVGPSPFSIRYRLHNTGVRPTSNVVDITNIVLLEHGQPLHAFDLDKLTNNKIIVRRASDGETMKTLDDEERTMTSDDLLICDGAGPVAIAGVMGGLESEVTDGTKNILIECAYFNPSSVRKTSKRLKLSSESSYRFERGVDPNHEEAVLAHTTAAMHQLAGGKAVSGIIDSYPAPVERIKTVFRPARYEQIMGHHIPSERMESIIKGLGCGIEPDGDQFQVEIPSWRPDMAREIDVIEEIARIEGMNTIEPSLPKIQCRAPENNEFRQIRKVKELLTATGLQEAVTYSFVSENSLKALKADSEMVHIANPLNAERATMRTTLLAGLLENLKRALSRYRDTFAQFEVAKTFHAVENNELPREQVKIAAVLCGSRPSWIGDAATKYDFFDVKTIVERLCYDMTGYTPVFAENRQSLAMHPHRCVDVTINEHVIGQMGELHPSVLRELKLPRGVVSFELDLVTLMLNHQVCAAQALVEFPPMQRDVALVVDQTQDAAPIAQMLQTECGDLATNVAIFDVYEGTHLEAGKKSLAFSITYLSHEKTLTDKVVDKAHNAGVSQTCAAFGASLR